MLEATFAEELCALRGVPPCSYSDLAWRLCSSWLTRCLRPLILRFVPRYFQADDDCLDLVAECRSRWEIDDAVQLLHVSYLRHGFLRYLGIGLNGDKLLRLGDKIAVYSNGGLVLQTTRLSASLRQGDRTPVNSSDEY